MSIHGVKKRSNLYEISTYHNEFKFSHGWHLKYNVSISESLNISFTRGFEILLEELIDRKRNLNMLESSKIKPILQIHSYLAANDRGHELKVCYFYYNRYRSYNDLKHTEKYIKYITFNLFLLQKLILPFFSHILDTCYYSLST